MVLYSAIQAATPARACALVAKCCRRRNSNSSVECQASITALSRAEPGRPMDWRTDRALARLPECFRGVFTALIGVQDDARYLSAAHRHGHGQRAVGQLRVMVLAQREPQHPA